MKEEHSFSAHYDKWIWATKTHSCTCVSQAILLGWIVLKTQDWKVPLGQRADWVTRKQAGDVVGLKEWCCETGRQLSAGSIENSVKGFIFWLSHFPIASMSTFSSLSNVCLTVIQPIGWDLVLSPFLSLCLLILPSSQTLWFTGCDRCELSPWSLCVSWVQPQNGTSLLLHVISWVL